MCGQKTALWLLPVGLACTVGAKDHVPFVGWHKIELKKCAVGKIKNTEALATSVVLIVVYLLYALYVGHLAKWFTFFSLLLVVSLLLCRPIRLLVTTVYIHISCTYPVPYSSVYTHGELTKKFFNGVYW